MKYENSNRNDDNKQDSNDNSFDLNYKTGSIHIISIGNLDAYL